MIGTTLHARGLTLPEALMPFLHNATGQPYHPARSATLTATAELAELVARGHADLVEGHVVVDAAVPSASADRDWIVEVTASCADTRTPVRAWVRGRTDALARQQDAAVDRGLLTRARGRLLGVGYDRLEVDTVRRRQIVTDLLATGDDERSLALAHLLVSSGLHRRNGLTGDERRSLEAVATRAEDLGLPAVDATAVALATVAFTAVLGG